MDGKGIIEYALRALKDKGADKAQVNLEYTEKQELNTEAKAVKLLRSTDATKLSLTFIKDQRKANTSISSTDEESVDNAILELLKLYKSAPVDEANDISSGEKPAYFSMGPQSADLDKSYEALEKFNEELKTKYKSVSGDAILAYDKKHRMYGNSNGVMLEESKGNYHFSMLFAAKDRDKITSFNYSDFRLKDLSSPLIEGGMLEELFHQTIKELDAKSYEGKFVGEMLVSPLCINELLMYLAGISLQDGSMISGTSILKDKLNEKVFSEKFNLSSNPRSLDMADGYAITGDGFIAQNVDIVEKGVLKSHLLSLYGAKKTGKERALNQGNAFEIKAGDKTFDQMLKNVKKGILLGRFSGGNPAPNGDFAGVAKNSFYIENGEIKYPIAEVMISGNLFEMLKNIIDISSYRVNLGNAILPWIHTEGFTISGK